MAHTLNYQLHRLCVESPTNSPSTKAARHKALQLVGRQLKEGGYKLASPSSLKPKHIEFLVKTWQSQGLSAGTIKNRMIHVRWWAKTIGKQGIVPRSNDALNIDRRSLIPTESKAKSLEGVKLELIECKRIRASLKLQEAFGLRREESIKFIPKMAQNGSQLVLKGSWCKGGRPRVIEIRTEAQYKALEEAEAVAKSGSLIPPNLKYVEQMRRFERQTAKAGISKTHGLRHRYAQQRYEELSGRKAPVNGGLSRKEMSPIEKALDNQFRHQISIELGHERVDVVAQYIGS